MATRITARNARFQVLQTLLTNRSKRHRAGEFIVQGVRPLNLALEHGWDVRALLYDADKSLSPWARSLLASQPKAEKVAMSSDLLAELSEKSEGAVEVLAVVGMYPDDLARIPVRPDFLGLVFDRPTQPGNIGSIIRSADALGAHGMITTGHAADAYDPKSVRASTGSFFALPTVRAAGPDDVMQWVEAQRSSGVPIVVAATDEDGDADISGFDLTQPVLLLVGNETAGLSRAWRDAADVTLSIPMAGAASSLNAANAASIVLYEARRQRATT
ncbi:TrmH family RNA methyltransferase [Oerskovia sp. NPDC057915]|uniref:TrmH family RNA methyltransferase n=1 Tax=Oerskovia sp. NPDC057915 TaxID=3346280 RepID=UPI0036DEE0D6